MVMSTHTIKQKYNTTFSMNYIEHFKPKYSLQTVQNPNQRLTISLDTVWELMWYVTYRLACIEGFCASGSQGIELYYAKCSAL